MSSAKPITKQAQIGERIQNEVFAAVIENVDYDIEGPGGVSPDSPVYRVGVVVSNPNPKSLRFEKIVVSVVGENGFEHSSSLGHGEPGSGTSAIMLPGQGFRIESTHPEQSIDVPKHIRVNLMHGDKGVASPIECIVDPKRIGLSERMKKLRDAGRPLTQSKAMFYRGPSALACWEMMTKKVHREHPRASLRLIQAASWSIYGNPETNDSAGIEIDSWIFAWIDDSWEGVFSVTSQAIDEREITGVVNHARRLLPLPMCKIDIESAIQISASHGNRIATGPSLRMYKVAGKPMPLWIMPGANAVQINALTGEVVDSGLIATE